MSSEGLYKDNKILQLTFKLSLGVLAYCEELDKLKKYRLSGQLVGAGLSIGANMREAQNAESKADFVHKCKIAAKEAEETEYYLLLCKESPTLPEPGDLLEQVQVIIKIINKIIFTTKQALNNKKGTLAH